jgi:hypothetical protein
METFWQDLKRRRYAGPISGYFIGELFTGGARQKSIRWRRCDTSEFEI